MEAACQRLCEGDTSSLVDIVNFIDAGKSHESNRLGTKTLTAIINILIEEGAELRRARGKDYRLPSPTAFFAIRILALLGIRQSDDGSEVKRALLVLGLQRCRDLCLDAYFALGRAQRYYVIKFVKLLTILYGCTPQDLLHCEPSINMLIGSLEPGQSSSHPLGATSSSEVVAHVSSPPSARGANGYVTSGASLRGNHLRSALLSTPSPPPPRVGTPISSRPSTIQNRSALLVSVPGASFDMPLRTTHRYRELPKKPINTPFAVNPLYEGPSAPGGDGAGAASLLNSRSATPSPLTPEEVPLVRIATRETTIPAQFPTPVVLFYSYYGLGCVPRLPTTDDLARLDAWRQERQQQPPPPRDLVKSVIKTGRGFAESGDAGRELGKVRLVALRSHPSSPTPEIQLQDFQVRNEQNFMPTNTATVPYQRQCLQSPLLQQYMDHGKLLSWGSSAKGALGPLRLRRTQNAFAYLDGTAANALPLPHSSRTSAPRNNCATTSYEHRFHSSNHSITGRASTDTVKSTGSLGVGATKPNKITTNNPPTTTVYKLATPLTSLVAATSGSLGGIDDAASTTTGHLKRDSPGAASGSSNHKADYVYLPTPVYTPARVAAIACGLSVTYVVTVDGVLYSCGRGENGQLGIGERSLRYAESGTSRLQCVLLKAGEAVTRVAAGTACAVAVASDRALYFWGHNVYGQCMKLPEFNRILTPVRLKTSMYKVLDICFGQFFGVLLFDDGIMGTWGIASMLGCTVGDKELEESLAPDQCKCARQVVHLELGAHCPMAAVRAGPWHALAISTQGAVYTWGVGRNGRLGHGTDNAEVKPRLVEALRSCFAVDASCASAHTAVLTSTGSVYVFGENTEGQLGLRGRSPRRLPVAMPLPCKAVAVACAREHTCVLLEDGDVVACGSYQTCGVGLGSGTRLCAPARILTNYVSLTLQCGHFHSLAAVLHRRTALMIVGHSTIDEVSRILSVVVRNGVRCAASGVGFLVVLSENNSLVSIGRGERGQLGIGDCMRPTSSDDVTVMPKFTPVQLPSGVVIQYLRCGPDYVVALDQNGAVYGWGSNERQKLCQPINVNYVYTPVRLGDYGKQHCIIQVACGGTFVVALTADGKVLAHGEAMYCGLGKEVRDSRKLNICTPTVIPTLHDIVAIAAGRRHAVAMTASCNIFAWGVGVLGCGTSAPHAKPSTPAAFTPVRVALSQNIRTIGCGTHNSFAITEEGELWVWGVNFYGECGVLPNREGNPRAAAGLSPLQHGDASTSLDGAARVIQTPISVARQVRDAAFTSQFGLVVFEDGQVRVSGRMRHGGHKYVLPSFHSLPQPRFSVDVNEPVQQHWRGKNGSVLSEPSRKQSVTAASAEAAQTPRTKKQEVISLGEEYEADDDEDDGDNSSTRSSLGSGISPHLMHSPASSRLPSSATDAALAMLVPRTRSTTTAELRPSQVNEPVRQRKRLWQRESADPLRRLSGGDGQIGPNVSSSASEVAGPPTFTTTTNANAAVDHDAAYDGAAGTASKLLSPISRESPTTRMTEEERPFVSRLSPLPASHLLPQTTDALREATETADASPPHSDLDAAADFFDGDAPPSLNVSINRDRNFPEADDGSPLQAPLSTASQENRSSVTQTREREGTSAQSPPPSSLPRPLQSPPPPSSISRLTHPTAPVVAPKRKTQPSSSPIPTGRSATSSILNAKATSNRSSSTRTPIGSKDAKPNTTPDTAATPATSTAAVKESCIFGIRCFAGWEQICVVMEKHRPSAKEVRMAQDGLKVLLH